MISVQSLSKSYGPRAAIDDLNFEIQSGEVVGFLGPNGAGKSTTMKILSGLMPATSGKAVIAGFDVFEKPNEVKRRVGYLPETPPVYLEMTVTDYLGFAALINEVAKKDVKRLVQEAIEKTGLKDVSSRIIGNLSKGYKQRVGLAQALVYNPPVLILDEPTVGLDPVQIIEIRELIKSLRGDHTVILSSHILPEVTATCERVIVINKGRIVAQDSIQSLTARMKQSGMCTMLVKSVSEDGVRAIKSVSGVRNVQVSGNKLLIELSENAGDIRDQIFAAAVKSGLSILEFGMESISLEEVFLQLTTKEDFT